MKNESYRNSKLKHELLARKRNGVREVIWKINDSQRDFIESKLGFYTEPYLYEVRTRKLSNVKNLAGVLKAIHYKKQKGKKVIVLKLTEQERKLLDKYEIKYKPYNFVINLN